MQTQEITFTLPRIKVIQESRKAFDSGYRIIVNQGGTRSGKTFSLIQYMIYLAFRHKYSISVCSVAFPHLRKGAMRDWRKIMEDFKLYDPGAHMKTEQLYTYPTGSYIEFFSVDNQLKVRGPGRDILFINECNIIQYETFRQLLLRTKRAIFIDYNPADEFHWIYDKVLTRPDCYFIKSTYNDNPFLPKEQRHEIESYKDADPNFWRIYGEGERRKAAVDAAMGLLKEREEFLRTLKEPLTAVDTDSGEVFTISPPLKTSKSGVKVKFT